MNLQSLRDAIAKIPLIPLLFMYLAYLGYDFYVFSTDIGSTLNQAVSQLNAAREDVTKLQEKIKKVNDFAKVLDLKRLELRASAQELESSKAILPEVVDVPDLMKTMVTEAKRAGLTVTSLKPLDIKTGDYYAEQKFQFSSTGIYFQYLAFLDRISNLQKIVLVDSMDFTPVGNTGSKYVQLKSDIQFKAYRYVASSEDQLGKDKASAAKGKGT